MTKTARPFFHFPRSISVFFFVFITALLLILYRDVLTGKKIAFPSNYLVHFYSPWSTQKFPGWEQGIPNKPIGTDQLRFFYPGITFSLSEIRSGRLPFWDPYIFSGSPHLANFQSAIFYPFNLIYLFLPQTAAWNFQVIIPPLLAFIFCYLYLRAISLSKIAAMFGAFAFGFSGFIIVWTQENSVVAQSALWLPLILYGIEKYLPGRNPKYLLLTCLAWTTSFLAGYFQITFYLSAFLLLYIPVRLYQERIKNKISTLLIIGFFFLLAMGLSGIQLIPSFEAFSQSPRPTVKINKVFDTYLLPVTFLVHTLAPDINGNLGSYNYFGQGSYDETMLYIGLIPMAFAAFAILKMKHRPNVQLLTFSAALSFLLTTNLLFVRKFLESLPFLSTFQPSRIFILTTFALAALAGIGMALWNDLEKGKDRKKLWLIVTAFIFILIITDLYFSAEIVMRYLKLVRFNPSPVKPVFIWYKTNEFVGIKNTVLPLLMLGIFWIFLLFRRLSRYVLFTAFALTVFGQFYFFSKYLNLGEPQFLYPENPVFSYLKQKKSSPDRYLAFGKSIFGNFAEQKGVYSPEGFDPIFSYRYGQLVFAAKNSGKITSEIPRIEVTLNELGDRETVASNAARLRLMSLLGVKHIFYYDDGKQTASPAAMFPGNLFRPVSQNGQWYTYDYVKALPRAFLADTYVLQPDQQKAVNLLFNPAFNLGTEIITEEPLPIQKSENQPSGSAVISRYEPQKITINTQTPAPKILFLSDNFYPGWGATVDNRPTKIYRADTAFRAVVVPAGFHTVTFFYQPDSFVWGLKLSVLSATVFLGFLFFSLYKYDRRP